MACFTIALQVCESDKKFSSLVAFLKARKVNDNGSHNVRQTLAKSFSQRRIFCILFILFMLISYATQTNKNMVFFSTCACVNYFSKALERLVLFGPHSQNLSLKKSCVITYSIVSPFVQSVSGLRL